MTAPFGPSPSDPPVAAPQTEDTRAEPPAMERPAYRWWLMASLAALVLLLFGASVGYGYSNWDDPIFVYRDNPFVQAATWENVRAIFTPTRIPREQIYVPLFYFSFLVEASIAGLKPSVTHGVNIALHLANVLLVFHLLRRLSGKIWPAYLAALAFAIHPVQAEAVVWAMGRKDLLSTFFGLISILCYLRYQENRDRAMIALSLLAFTAGVLSKPTLLTLPGVFVLLDFLRLPTVGTRDFGNKIGFIAACIFIYTLNSQYPTDPPDVDRGMLLRLACLPWMLWHWWLRLGLAEQPIAVYTWPDHLGVGSILGLGALALAVLAGLSYWAWRGRDRQMAIGLGFAALAGLPAASIVLSSRPFVTADRYGYFPLIGFFFAVAIGIWKLPPTARKVAVAVVGVWLCAAAAMTPRANLAWSDSRILWQRVVAVSPDSAIAWQHLAVAHAEASDIDAADHAFRTALVLQPDDSTTRWNYQTFLALHPDLPALLRSVNEALANDPDDPRALAARHALGDFMANPEAEVALLRTVAKRQDYIPAWLLLAGFYDSQDRPEDAIRCYRRILILDPANPRARHALDAADGGDAGR